MSFLYAHIAYYYLVYNFGNPAALAILVLEWRGNFMRYSFSESHRILIRFTIFSLYALTAQ
jgi:hypothetical protein